MESYHCMILLYYYYYYVLYMDGEYRFFSDDISSSKSLFEQTGPVTPRKPCASLICISVPADDDTLFPSVERRRHRGRDIVFYNNYTAIYYAL